MKKYRKVINIFLATWIIFILITLVLSFKENEPDALKTAQGLKVEIESVETLLNEKVGKVEYTKLRAEIASLNNEIDRVIKREKEESSFPEFLSPLFSLILASFFLYSNNRKEELDIDSEITT